MHFRFSSAKRHAATEAARALSLQNWFTTPFCLIRLDSSRIRQWYQARVHPFRNGNGKGIHTRVLLVRSLCFQVLTGLSA